MPQPPTTIHSGPQADLLAGACEHLSDRELLDRFVRRHDQVAFEALLQRHAPMVLAACRRVLGSSPEAEDAFQATFLVFLRKAGSIRQPDLLGSWLYGVARRVAQKALAQGALRREREANKEPAAMPPDPQLEVAWSELCSVLDEELQQLPAKYRAPLVLCYLEGLTNEEAARRLGWPTGSISYRLARGREMLRARLGRRCHGLTPALFAGLLIGMPTVAGVPSRLLDLMMRVAALADEGVAETVVLSPAVVNLAVGSLSASGGAARWKWLLLMAAILLLSLTGAAVADAMVRGAFPGLSLWSDPYAAPAAPCGCGSQAP